MAAWKFTDVYGTDYPALANSILSSLVFDITGDSPISGTTFNATLDLAATGTAMKVLSTLLGLSTVPMTGTVTADDTGLKIDLRSTNNDDILKALVACIPLIGGKVMQAASLAIQTQTTKKATADDDPDTDEIDLTTTISIGQGTGIVVARVPMSDGVFSLSGTFQGLSIRLSDLDFLVPGAAMQKMFPGDGQLPTSYYDPASTALSLLELDLALDVQTKSSLQVSVSSVTVSIGIINIPLYPNALFLNPLAVCVTVLDPLGTPSPTWGLSGSIALYPYGQQTPTPSVAPDFVYELSAEMPTDGKSPFSVTGTLENPQDLSVGKILKDFANDGTFDTGVADQLTIDQFDFAAQTEAGTGTISEFSVEVAMSSAKTNGSYFGIFNTGLGVKNFSVSVKYQREDGGKK